MFLTVYHESISIYLLFMKHNLYEYNVKYKLFVVCVFKLVWCVTKKKKKH